MAVLGSLLWTTITDMTGFQSHWDEFSFSFIPFFIFLTFFFKFPQDVFKCSCLDSAYQIPLVRARENYDDGAFWCSGTLNMLGYDQNPVVIFNPYSYADLQDMLIGLDAYLKCTSTGGMGMKESGDPDPVYCEQLRPSISLLEQQGVSSIAVLARYLLLHIFLNLDVKLNVLLWGEAKHSNIVLLLFHLLTPVIPW